MAASTDCDASTAKALHAHASLWAMREDGIKIEEITLKNAHGMTATFVSYGATLISVCVPSRTGESEEVTLCRRSLEGLATSPYYGSTVGRVANRIARGRFEVEGKAYELATNNGPNHLHGGITGFDKVVWNYELYTNADATGVAFSYTSRDGEEGYPGTLKVTAEYKLTNANELVMHFSATTDKATPVNICNHAYWNLSGNMREDIRTHVLKLHCPHYLPVDKSQIPTGELAAVGGTPFDFTAGKPIGADLMDCDGGGEPGYDHCFARADAVGELPRPLEVIAELSHPASGRRMVVSTTQPGIQVYTGNFLSKDPTERPHTQHNAVCLETENFPDAINHPRFPSCVLMPEQTYSALTVHKFEW